MNALYRQVMRKTLQSDRISVPLHPSKEKVNRYGKNSYHQREHFRQMDEERGKAARTSQKPGAASEEQKGDRVDWY